MKTDAVICIALTRTRPSWTPLLRTISWIFGVMLRKSIRAGMLKVRYSVCDFMMTGLPRDRKRGTETTSISFTGGRSKATPAFSPEAARDSGEKIRACGQSLVEQLKIGSRITSSLDAVPRVAHAASAQHRGAGRFDGVRSDCGVEASQRPGHPGERAARSDHVHEDVDLSLGLCPELRPRVPLMGQNVAFAPELIDAEGAAPRHDLRGFCLDKRQVLARDLAVHGSLGLFKDNDLRPERLHPANPLDRIAARDQRDEGVPHGAANDRQTRAGVAAGQLDDGLPGAQLSRGAGFPDDLQGDPVFLASTRAEVLELDEQPARQPTAVDAASQLDQRSAADHIENGASQGRMACVHELQFLSHFDPLFASGEFSAGRGSVRGRRRVRGVLDDRPEDLS